ncbi:MAG: DNA repair protein RecO [Bacteroidaceae bacterium]
MLVKSLGIVLRTFKYNDTQNIVDVYTEAMGRVSFMVRIPRSRRATIKNVLFQPMAVLLLEWNARPTIQLQKVQTVKSAIPFSSIPYNQNKLSIALFLSEFLCGALREEQHNSSMFQYILMSIEWFDGCTDRCANFHLVFLLRLSQFLGFYPNLDQYHQGAYFDLLSSCFVDKQPLHHHYVNPTDACHLPLLMRMRYETLHKFVFSRQERERLLSVINDYYRLHIPSFPQLKSLEVLKEVFG